jgi:hypothetical protein
VGLGAGLVQETTALPHAWDSDCAQAHLCSQLSLSLCSCACVHLFSSHLFFGGVVAGCSYHCVWLVALDVHWAHFWIALSMAGVTAEPKESGGMGQCPCAHTHTPVCFPSSPCGGRVKVCV